MAETVFNGGRFDRLDALRAVAMLWMAAYHLCFDLQHFRLLQPPQNFYADPFWTVQRTCIVTLFLLCAGAGQALAVHAGQTWGRFWRRWLQVAGCAALVSVASMVMFPRSWIFFGVLHGLLVMLVAVRVAMPAGRWLWALGALGMVLPAVASSAAFDAAIVNVLGLGTRKPVTEDWVPVLPWLGVVFWGAAAARWLLERHPAVLRGPLPRVARPLAVLGRWSLSFYMLHQPVLIGVIVAALWLGRGAAP